MIELKLEVPSQEQFNKLVNLVREIAEQHNELEKRVDLLEHAMVHDVPLESLDHDTLFGVGKP